RLPISSLNILDAHRTLHSTAVHTRFRWCLAKTNLLPDKKERCFGQASSNLTIPSPRSGNSSFVHVADATWSSDEAQPQPWSAFSPPPAPRQLRTPHPPTSPSPS
ncbi:unnamed protein product, partial [Ectocarpus sp. 12 AP-2014]